MQSLRSSVTLQLFISITTICLSVSTSLHLA